MLLHGLTATRRYVVMGSRALRALGPSRRSPTTRAATALRARRRARAVRLRAARATTSAAVLDALAIERAVLAGASMGAHTAAALRARAPRARRGAGADHAVVRSRTRRATSASSPAGTRSRAGCARAGVEGFVARL